MRHSILRHHIQKEIIFKRNVYRKDNEQTDKVNKQRYRKKTAQNLFLMPYHRRDYRIDLTNIHAETIQCGTS